MAYLFCVKDLESVDLWRADQELDERIVVSTGMFLTFKSVAELLGTPVIEISDSEMVVED